VRQPAVYLLAAALLALAAACGEDGDPVIGFDLAPGILDSTAVRTVLVPDSNLDTFFQTTRNAGDVVWAGFEPEVGSVVEAKAFLRFPTSPIPDTAVVVGATLILNADAGGDYGDRVAQDLEVQVATDLRWLHGGWPFDYHSPASPPSVFTVAECDTPLARVTAAVPPGVVGEWVAEHDKKNYGVVLVPRGTGGWKRFRATFTSVGQEPRRFPLQAPKLEVRYLLGSTADTLQLDLGEHATLYSVSPDVEGGTGFEPAALIGGPYDFRAVVGFDLSAIGTDVNWNGLRLALKIDPSSVFHGQVDPSVTIGAHEILSFPGESLDQLPAVGFVTNPIDEVAVDATTDTTIILNLSTARSRIRKGVLLKVEQEFPSLIRLGIVTREGSLANDPSLEVTYTLPPRIRL